MALDAGIFVRCGHCSIQCSRKSCNELANGYLSLGGSTKTCWPALAYSFSSLTCWYTSWAYSHASHSSSSWLVHRKWDWEWSKCIYIEFEHLVALVIVLVAWLLVNLGGCCHLDGLKQQDHWAEGGDCLRLRSAILWVVLVPSPRERFAKGNYCGSLVALSNLSYVGSYGALL
jgi:hypothetical protein